MEGTGRNCRGLLETVPRVPGHGARLPHKDKAPSGAVLLRRQLLQVLKLGACHLLGVQLSK